jgi:hypothetical protein
MINLNGHLAGRSINFGPATGLTTITAILAQPSLDVQTYNAYGIDRLDWGWIDKPLLDP